jgi:hypothetical protein
LTIYFKGDKDSINFGGWMSYQWISVIWIVSHDIIGEKKIDFNRHFEVLDIKYLKDCDEFTSDMDYGGLMMNIEHQGVNSISETSDFLMKLIK